MLTLAAFVLDLSLALLPPHSCDEVGAKAAELARVHAAGVRVGAVADEWTAILMHYLHDGGTTTPETARAWALDVCRAGGGPDLRAGFI